MIVSQRRNFCRDVMIFAQRRDFYRDVVILVAMLVEMRAVGREVDRDDMTLVATS